MIRRYAENKNYNSIYIFYGIVPRWKFWILEMYEGESISNQPNLFPVEIHLYFFDVIAR